MRNEIAQLKDLMIAKRVKGEYNQKLETIIHALADLLQTTYKRKELRPDNLRMIADRLARICKEAEKPKEIIDDDDYWGWLG